MSSRQQPDLAAIQAELRAALTPLLVRRMRAGIWLLVAALLLFALEIFAVYQAHAPSLLRVKGVQLLTLMWGYWALSRRPEAWRRSIWIGLVVLVEVCITTVISSIITDDPVSALLLFIVLTMGTAMLLPWGAWPQIATVTVAAVMVAVNMIWVPAPQGGLESAAVATLLAFLTSVYASYALDRSRTARAVAEAGERSSDAWRGAVADAALDSIITIDDHGKILEFNPAAERTFGYRRADVLGRTMADLIIPPAQRAAHREGMARFHATGVGSLIGKRIDTTAMRADGSKFPVELAIARVPQPGPAVFIGYLRDMSSLAQEARTAGALVRVGNEMMSLLDIARILDRLCALTTEVLGCECSDSFLWQPREQRYVWAAGFGRAPETVRPRAGGGIPRSAVASLLARLQPAEPVVLRASGGGEAGAVLLHPGVTSALCTALCHGEEMIGIHVAAYHGRNEPFSAQELRVARGLAQTASMALSNARLIEEVEHANHVKSEFLSTMSHELRTPLAALLGYAEILDGGELDAAERAHCIQRIRAVGTELLELIESTLEISRVEAGRDDVRLEPIHLLRFCAALAEQCAQMPRHAEVAFDWRCDAPDTAIVSDPRKLSVLLRNLISNGFKFTDHGMVRLDAALGADRVSFQVSDTGIGIARENQAVIFDMFRQGDRSHVGHHGGAGFGLYIVRRFVDQLGGTISVDSAPGQGSTFTVTLPRVDAGAVADDAREAGARTRTAL
jgi:PAS domain S-box-containing protein